jgi:hypothetical protein
MRMIRIVYWGGGGTKKSREATQSNLPTEVTKIHRYRGQN